MSGQTFSTFTEVGMVDARLQAGAITLPTTTSIPYRILTLKDVYGATTQSTVTIQTQAGDTFEDGTTSRALNASWASMSLYAGVPGIWYTIGGSVLTSASISSLTVSSIYGLQGFVSTPYLETQLGSTVVGLGTAGYISSSQLLSTSLGLTEYISSFIDPTELTSTVVGLGTQGFVSSLGLTYAVASTAQGLGTFGYTSTSQLLSTSLGLYQQIQTSPTNITQTNLTSTITGLGTFGYLSTVTLGSLISTANLANHVSTANLATLVSTANLANHVSTANLANLVSTANLANHVSTANLANLVSTANLANHVSTANLANLVSTNYLATQLGSTVVGLGSAGYLSTGFSTLISQAFLTSSLSTTNINTANINSLTATISSLTVNALFIGTGTGFTDIGDTIGTSMSTITITANTITAITLSTQQLNVSSITGISIVSQTNLTSTVIGLGTAGYLSSVINGLISTANLTNLVSTANLANLVSTANLTNFVSTANLTNLVSTANLANLVSTIYIATQLGSTVIGLGTAGYISSSQLLSTSLGLTQYMSSFIDPTELTSTVIGLGTAGFVSSLGLTYAVASTAQGLGTFGYTSTSQLLSTSLGLYQEIQTSPVNIKQSNVTSTIIGLGTFGYLSTVALGSLISTANLANLVSTANLVNLVSTANLANLVSTANLANFVSTTYLSTQLGSTFATLTVSSLSTFSLQGTNAFISSLTVNGLFAETDLRFRQNNVDIFTADSGGINMLSNNITNVNTISALSTQQITITQTSGSDFVLFNNGDTRMRAVRSAYMEGVADAYMIAGANIDIRAPSTQYITIQQTGAGNQSYFQFAPAGITVLNSRSYIELISQGGSNGIYLTGSFTELRGYLTFNNVNNYINNCETIYGDVTNGISLNMGGASISIASDSNIYFSANGTAKYANFQDTNVAFNTGTPGSLLMNMNGNDIINVRTLTASNSSSPVTFYNSTSAANYVIKCEMIGANFIIRQSANASAIAVIENTGGGGLLINPVGTGNIGIGSSNISYKLDVAGIARSGIPVSSLTGTSATFGANAFGIYYYITNSAFSNIGLYNTSAGATGSPGAAPPIGTGWYVTLRNNTGSYLSITVNGLLVSTPASPFTIPPSNSVTIAYDANLAGGAGYVFF